MLLSALSVDRPSGVTCITAMMARSTLSLLQFCIILISYCTLTLSSPLAAAAKKGALHRRRCQYPTPNPLDGCPEGTLLVGPNATYTTIQSAVAALDNGTSPATILILPGNYTEQVNVTRSAPVYLLGQTANPKDYTTNQVNVIWRAVAGTGDNAYTATLTIAPNIDAALTGSGM